MSFSYEEYKIDIHLTFALLHKFSLDKKRPVVVSRKIVEIIAKFNKNRKLRKEKLKIR